MTMAIKLSRLEMCNEKLRFIKSQGPLITLCDKIT